MSLFLTVNLILLYHISQLFRGQNANDKCLRQAQTDILNLIDLWNHFNNTTSFYQTAYD